MKKTALLTLLLLCGGLQAESLYGDKVRSRLADTDGDGVIDARDQCANTSAGAQVNNYGCPQVNTKLLSVELNILFDSGKSLVKPHFYSELKTLANFLQDNASATVVIEGHTDDVGSTALNESLSQSRASAIADVLTQKFRISPTRVKGIGYGESRPLVSNETPEGRKQNRRVVAEVFAKQVADSMRWTIYSVNESPLYSTR